MFNTTGTALLLGVVAIDLDFTSIENSIYTLNVINEDGYAYMLAPGGNGSVVLHKDIDKSNGSQTIQDLEKGVDEEEFGDLVTKMSEECTGSGTYTKSGETWLLSWTQENVSSSAATANGPCDGFVVVITVREPTLLKVGAASRVAAARGASRYCKRLIIVSVVILWLAGRHASGSNVLGATYRITVMNTNDDHTEPHATMGKPHVHEITVPRSPPRVVSRSFSLVCCHLQEFSEIESNVRDVVVVASVAMGMILLAMSCITACFARAISNSITMPVNQLIDVLIALNRHDFSQQVPLNVYLIPCRASGFDRETFTIWEVGRLISFRAVT